MIKGCAEGLSPGACPEPAEGKGVRGSWRGFSTPCSRDDLKGNEAVEGLVFGLSEMPWRRE